MSSAIWRGPILTIHQSYDVFLCRQEPFGSRNQAAPHLAVKSSKNPRFGGMSRHFKLLVWFRGPIYTYTLSQLLQLGILRSRCVAIATQPVLRLQIRLIVHPSLCNSVCMRPRTDRQTGRQTDARDHNTFCNVYNSHEM